MPGGEIIGGLDRVVDPIQTVTVAGGAAGFAGAYYWGGKKGAAKRPQRPPPKPAYVEIAAHNPRKGPKAAKVTIVEFSDFQ